MENTQGRGMEQAAQGADLSEIRARATSSGGGQSQTTPVSDLMTIPRERRATWTRVITQAKAALFQTALTPDELEGTIVAFENVCAHIPTEMLHAVYRQSMQPRYDAKGVLQGGFWDARSLLVAWGEIQEGRRRAPRYECTLCGGKGRALVFDRESGEEIEKECPTCVRASLAVAVRGGENLDGIGR